MAMDNIGVMVNSGNMRSVAELKSGEHGNSNTNVNDWIMER